MVHTQLHKTYSQVNAYSLVGINVHAATAKAPNSEPLIISICVHPQAKSVENTQLKSSILKKERHGGLVTPHHCTLCKSVGYRTELHHQLVIILLPVCQQKLSLFLRSSVQSTFRQHAR